VRGRFISLEGPEGGGKSTLLEPLAQKVRNAGFEVLTTREPGAGKFGAQVRAALLHGENLEPWTEAFLFLADRSQHCSDEIRPALERGVWVICDRFADSTIVYQGYARGLDIELLRRLNQIASQGAVPDLTLLLDLAPETGLERIAKKDRLDSEPVAFHHRVRAGFLKEAELDQQRWRILDAALPPDELLDEAWFHVHHLIDLVRP